MNGSTLVSTTVAINGFVHPLHVPLDCSVFQLKRLVQRLAANFLPAAPMTPFMHLKVYMRVQGELRLLREGFPLSTVLSAQPPPEFQASFD